MTQNNVTIGLIMVGMAISEGMCPLPELLCILADSFVRFSSSVVMTLRILALYRQGSRSVYILLFGVGFVSDMIKPNDISG